jgi:hypothetical protein
MPAGEGRDGFGKQTFWYSVNLAAGTSVRLLLIGGLSRIAWLNAALGASSSQDGGKEGRLSLCILTGFMSSDLQSCL